jgi:hypothetical protein
MRLSELPPPEAERVSSIVITLPPNSPDLQTALEAKLQEYKSRLTFENPEETFYGTEYLVDALYKKLILEELLRKGELNTDKLKARMAKEGGSLNEPALMNAARVIEDYVLTGGKKVRGGKGLDR